jgi:hypothetical protein
MHLAMGADDGVRRRELIRRRFEPCRGLSGEFAADSLAKTWQQVSCSTAPITATDITGFYHRSLHLLKPVLPIVRSAPVAYRDVLPIEHLKLLSAQRDPEETCEFAIALLITFTELLADVIGDDMTTRLTFSAFAEMQ